MAIFGYLNNLKKTGYGLIDKKVLINTIINVYNINNDLTQRYNTTM